MRFNSVFWLTVLLVFTMTAHAGGIYRWTDENGRVHFGDRPTHMGAEQIKGAPAGDAVTAERIQHQQELVENYKEKQVEKRAETVTAVKDKKTRAKKCEEAKARVTKYQNARFLYRKNDDGERHVLRRREREAAQAKAQAQVTQYCS